MAKAVGLFTAVAVMLIATAAADYLDDFTHVTDLEEKLMQLGTVCTHSDMAGLEKVFQDANWTNDQVNSMFQRAEIILDLCFGSINEIFRDYASDNDDYTRWLAIVDNHARFPYCMMTRKVEDTRNTALNPEANPTLKSSIEEYGKKAFQRNICHHLQEEGELFDHYEMIKTFLEGEWQNLRLVMWNYWFNSDSNRDGTQSAARFYLLGIVCENFREQAEKGKGKGKEPNPVEGTSRNVADP